MAHFVALLGRKEGVDPAQDRLQVLCVNASGAPTAQIAVYGAGARGVTVKVVSGPGTVGAGASFGANMMTFPMSRLDSTSYLQAFKDGSAVSEALPVVKVSGSGIAAQNEALLRGGGSTEVFRYGGRTATIVPLAKGFGGFQTYNFMPKVNGLAMHITAGGGSADSQKANYETRGASTHFVVDRSGAIAQYVACSMMANAQGPGNVNWISVEAVGQVVVKGSKILFDSLTESQVATLSDLFSWVYVTFPAVTSTLGTAFVGNKKAAGGADIGFGLPKVYAKIAEVFTANGLLAATSTDINTCINSTGLSCHWWLDHAVKSCPGPLIMAQLPRILGYNDLGSQVDFVDGFALSPRGKSSPPAWLNQFA